MKIFIDTNVLLDVLLERKGVAEDSASIWALCERKGFEGYISAISFNNTHYVISKIHSRKKAEQAMHTLIASFDIISLDKHILSRAVDGSFKDFEDAIQFYSAVRCDADYIITRNVKDFPQEDMPVLTPEDFLRLDLNFT